MIFSLIIFGAYKTINQQDLDALNKVLKNSLYKTSILIDDNGAINRKDNNGNTFTYNISDVSHIRYDDDGFHNLIVVLKKGRKSKGFVEGKEVTGDINVIAFAKKVDCDKAIELFKKIIESQK